MLKSVSTLLVRIRIPVSGDTATVLAIIGGIILGLLILALVILYRRQRWAKVVLGLLVAVPALVGGLILYQHLQRASDRARRISHFYDQFVQAGAAEGAGLSEATMREALRKSCPQALGYRRHYGFALYLLPPPETLRRTYHLEDQTDPLGASQSGLELAVWKVADPNHPAGTYADGTPLPDLVGKNVVVVAAVKEIIPPPRPQAQPRVVLAARVYHAGRAKKRLCEGTVTAVLPAMQPLQGPSLLRSLAAAALAPVCSAASGDLCYVVHKYAVEL